MAVEFTVAARPKSEFLNDSSGSDCDAILFYSSGFRDEGVVVPRLSSSQLCVFVRFFDKVIHVPVVVQRHVPMVVETVQFSHKDADVPVISTTCARGGPDSAVLAVQCAARGDSTGAVLGQGVHARRCGGPDVQETV